MKRFFFILTAVLLIPCHSFESQADVEKLSGPDYFPAVDKALNEAKKSIFLVMYYIDFRKDETESKVSILVDDLVKAKDRDIDVKVILDQTVVFGRTGTGGKKMMKEEKNRRAFNYLKENGINVLYDNLEIYTHGKINFYRISNPFYILGEKDERQFFYKI